MWTSVIEISSSTGRTRKSGCRTSPIGRVVRHGAVGCVRWRSRRCTPDLGSLRTHRGGRLGVAWPVDDASRRGRPGVRWWVGRRCAARRAATPGRRLELRRRLRDHSCSSCTADQWRGVELGPRPCVAFSSGDGARVRVHRRHIRVLCRSGRARGRVPATPSSRASVRARPPSAVAAERLAFGGPENHPS